MVRVFTMIYVTESFLCGESVHRVVFEFAIQTFRSLGDIMHSLVNQKFSCISRHDAVTVYRPPADTLELC